MTASTAALRELHRSKRFVALFTALRSRWLQLLGPAFVVSRGSIDPDNWATDLVAGTYGYRLLWGADLATLIARRFPHSRRAGHRDRREHLPVILIPPVIIMSRTCGRAPVTATAGMAAVCIAFDAIMLPQTIRV